MIRCTLELFPGGLEDPEAVEHLGTIEISNNLVESILTEGKKGTYNFTLYKKRKHVKGFRGKVEGYPRKSYSVWELVRRALNQAHDAGRL